MISGLIALLIIGLILFLIYYVCGLFIKGQPHQVIGIILALIFLLYALHAFGLLGGVAIR
jgi:ABC-type multidrug transport system permease subunit